MTTSATRIRGVIPPLATPLSGRDELDLRGLERLIDYELAAGVSGLFMLGSTGEAPTISYRLRYELVERTCELVAGRVPILVGVIDTSLEEALELTKFARGCGATAVVAAAPYYFSIGQTEARNYLSDLADDATLPLFIYNIPPCVDMTLEFETYESLSSHPNICGFKDSSGDIVAFRRLLELRSVRPDWSMLMGHESLLGESVLLGSDGGVPGGGNLLPKLFVDIFHAAERGERHEVQRLQIEIERLGQLYTLIGTGARGYLCGLKAAMEAAGLCSGLVAPPFRSLNSDDKAKVAEFVRSIGADLAVASLCGERAVP